MHIPKGAEPQEPCQPTPRGADTWQSTSAVLGEEKDGNPGPLRWAWQHGQGRLSSGTPPSHQRDMGANTGPCLTGRQEASGGQGWEPTQGPTGDLMADARGPSHAVQSVPAVSGGPQVAKGRLAPVGWGWGEGGESGGGEGGGWCQSKKSQ